MKKSILITLSLLLLLTACQTPYEKVMTSEVETRTPAPIEYPEEFSDIDSNIDSTSATPSDTTEASDSLAALGDLDVDKGLFNVELTIPADFVGETTQDELNTLAQEQGYKSITLNSDGSATYTMTKEQHNVLMDGITESINTSLNEMIGSTDYPNFTAITANDDFTHFKVTTKSTELDFAESFSIIAFYLYGGMYHAFNGSTVDNIHVDFINADSRQIIESADSANMQ